MCAPTVLARAVTALNEEQSSFAHTVNVRRLPGPGGPAGSGVTVVGDGTAADRASAAPPTDSATWDASAEPHAGSAGAEVLEQPAAARKDHTTRCTALRRFMPTSALALPASCSGPDVHPQLHAAGPPHRRAAEERALEEILVVEHVVHVQLRPNHHVADRPGVPGAGVEDEVRRYVVRLVEVEQAGPVRRVRRVRIDQSRPVDPGC